MLSFFHMSQSDLGNSLEVPSVTEPAVSLEYDSVGSWKTFWSSGRCYHNTDHPGVRVQHSSLREERNGNPRPNFGSTICTPMALEKACHFPRLSDFTCTSKWCGDDAGKSICHQACKYSRNDSFLPTCLGFPSARWGIGLDLRGPFHSHILWLCQHHLRTFPANTPVRHSL